ncbi:hypothetical protein E2C01_093436 [Portunus trituberculatus]|uniref:Uncharacterized protein n=1 Tax=Portunus trituberculatus TaxID=210409 RepID=A0A5B7JU03_PORTR|nr:hypothetical protein [Portunus trituberculatus]
MMYTCRQLPHYWVRIQKRFAFSPRVFSKATNVISGVFNSVSPVSNVEILSICL